MQKTSFQQDRVSTGKFVILPSPTLRDISVELSEYDWKRFTIQYKFIFDTYSRLQEALGMFY